MEVLLTHVETQLLLAVWLAGGPAPPRSIYSGMKPAVLGAVTNGFHYGAFMIVEVNKL